MIPPLRTPLNASCCGEGRHSAMSCSGSSPDRKLRIRRPSVLAGPHPKQRPSGANRSWRLRSDGPVIGGSIAAFPRERRRRKRVVNCERTRCGFSSSRRLPSAVHSARANSGGSIRRCPRTKWLPNRTREPLATGEPRGRRGALSCPRHGGHDRPNAGAKVVPKMGFEPIRGCPQRCLRPPRLPFRHFGADRHPSGAPSGSAAAKWCGAGALRVPRDDRRNPGQEVGVSQRTDARLAAPHNRRPEGPPDRGGPSLDDGRR
jgi:hypothetical protein